MPGEKMFMSLGIEYGYEVPSIVEIGMFSVVFLGVHGLVELWVTSDVALGIPGVVDCVFLGVVSLGYATSVPSKILF